MIYSELINKAIEFASIAHEKQYRKNPERKIPYISHCVMVGYILQKALFDEEVVCAGILHDVIEDTGISKEEIEREFGEKIKNLVWSVSEEDKSLPWEIRKAKYIEKIKNASSEAKAISIADKIHNLHSMISSLKRGGDIWSNMKRGKELQIERHEKLLEVFKSSWNHPLVDEFAKVLDELKKLPL